MHTNISILKYVNCVKKIERTIEQASIYTHLTNANIWTYFFHILKNRKEEEKKQLTDKAQLAPMCHFPPCLPFVYFFYNRFHTLPLMEGNTVSIYLYGAWHQPEWLPAHRPFGSPRIASFTLVLHKHFCELCIIL